MPKTNLKERGKQQPHEDTTLEDPGGSISLSDIMNEIKIFRTETTENFETAKKDIKGIKEEIGQLNLRIGTAEERIAETESRDIELTKVLIQVLRKQKLLEEKCQDLESRSRRKNLRIYSVPEKSEGNNMVEFIYKFLNERLGITGVRIERAHRAAPLVTDGGADRRPGTPKRPGSIVVRFQSYVEKQRVLQAAWTKKDIRIKDSRIFFDEDFSAQVYKERAKYRQVRKQLYERNIKTRILYPAKLKLFLSDGKYTVFKDPPTAAEGLREFGITMESSPKEPDLEATLQAAGWESPRRGRGGRADELTSSLNTLIRLPTTQVDTVVT
ncbi:unnamed protein product [Knipowitschia caucasica]|uniref:L1 transposable element RRM domain-containing protein n=1 Tax=Knipowitschia caucasica TaxID=637954 RepID=A0AAV2LLA2_KNICA